MQTAAELTFSRLETLQKEGNAVRTRMREWQQIADDKTHELWESYSDPSECELYCQYQMQICCGYLRYINSQITEICEQASACYPNNAKFQKKLYQTQCDSDDHYFVSAVHEPWFITQKVKFEQYTRHRKKVLIEKIVPMISELVSADYHLTNIPSRTPSDILNDLLAFNVFGDPKELLVDGFHYLYSNMDV